MFEWIAGLHIVYTLKRENEKILIIIIGAREDEEVYELAEKRIQHMQKR